MNSRIPFLKKEYSFFCTIIMIFSVFLPTAECQTFKNAIRLDSDTAIREVQKGAFVVTHSFPWPANSLFVVIGEHDMVFVDTPYTPEATDIVLDWINSTFGERHIIEINTGYHVDNLGGNQSFINRDIPVYGSDKTVSLLEEKGEDTRSLTLGWLESPKHTRFHDRHATIPYLPPNHIFPLTEGKTLGVGDETIHIIFPGETHTADNTVVYFPERKLLFGGCMILAGNKPGNTSDANMKTWKDAVSSLKSLDYETVIPGHGLRFDPELIENTIRILP